jgi:integrase
VTTRLALDWATLPQDALPSWWAARLRVVRGFARHLQALDPATEVPPAGLLTGRNRRAVPCLYCDAEVAALMAATACLRPALHAAAHETLIGLLSATGMRLGEAIRLDRAGLDATEGTVTIRDSKFAKSRQIPLHPGTLAALAGYGRLRDRRFPEPTTPALLVSTAGTRLISQGIHYVFARLVRQAGLQPRSPECRPRLHDFRHSLAVNQLLAWYRQGEDVQARLPLLSALPGHSQPANTYWYLSAVPELLALAAERRQAGLRTRS